MKLNVYSVFDVKAAVYAHPFFMPNDAVAIRGFSGAVNSPETMLFKHPEDYSLYRLGTFDDAVGKLESEPQPVVLVTAAAVVVPNRVRETDGQVLQEKVHIAASVAK